MEDEKRPRRAQIVRFLYFCTGVVIMGLGIALTTRSGLGTSPISAPMWVLAIRGPWSFGQWTFAINTLFVILQFVLLRRNFPLIALLQIPAAIVFGMAIDAWMWVIQALNPTVYPLQMLQLLAGATILGIGVAVQVAPKSMYLAGEGMVMALSQVTGVHFHRMKIIFDCTLVALAIAMSFIFVGELVGVREGTVIAAVLVGVVVGKCAPMSHRILARLEKPGS